MGLGGADAALDVLVRYDGWGAPITIEPPVRG
mgnify:CR=1 FL=1